MKKKGICGILGLIAFIIVLIGALNWGLVGAFDFNLVTVIFGYGIVTKIIYIVVGVAALYKIVFIVIKKNMKKD